MSPGIALMLVLMGPSVADAGMDVREILDEARFAFCHDEDYPLSDEEARWCPLLESGTPSCPAFSATCDGPRAEMTGPRGPWSIRKRRLDPESSAPQKTKRQRDESRPRRTSDGPSESGTMPSFGLPAQMLFWIIIGGALLVLGFSIRGNIVTGRREHEPEPGSEPGDIGGEGAATVANSRHAAETDVGRLLGLAEQAAARQEYDAAVDYTHAALLRRLDHDELIRLHRSRTNGDYVRQLRSRPKIHKAVREVLQLVDAAQFDAEPTTAGAFETLLTKVRTIVTQSGPLALALLLAVTAGVACESLSRATYPWSVSPSGHAAIVALLRKRGAEVEVRNRPDFTLTDSGEPSVPAMLLLGGVEPEEATWETVAPWFASGGQLVVAATEAPRWLGVRPVIDESEDSLRRVTEPYWDGTSVTDFMLSLPTGGGIAGLSGSDVFLARGDTAYAGYVPHGAGGVVVLGTDALFCNASMAVPGNAQYAVELLEHQGDTVHIVTGRAGSSASPNPVEGIRRTHLTAAVVQLVLFLLVFYAWRGARFGSGRDPRATSRRRFAQHARALGQHYQRANAQQHAAAMYCQWALGRLRMRFPADARRGLQGLSEACARQSGRDETDIVGLLVRAHCATTDEPSDDTETDGVSIIAELGKLLRATGRPR